MDATQLRARVDALAFEPERLRRRLIALGALTALLAPGIEPILVGGCALELLEGRGGSRRARGPRHPRARAPMIPYEDFIAEVRRRKAAVWADVLAREGPGPVAGRRPRDPEQEALLTELDRRRIAESELLRDARRVPAKPLPPGRLSGEPGS